MMRPTSSADSGSSWDEVCTTMMAAVPKTPIVHHRSSCGCGSRTVAASGSLNTSIAVSNSMPWSRRLARFLFGSHSQINGFASAFPRKVVTPSGRVYQAIQNREPFSWCSGCPSRPLASLMPLPCCSEDVCCRAGRGTAGAGARRCFGPIELALEVLSYCLADRHRRQVHMGLDPGGRIRLLQPVYEP